MGLYNIFKPYPDAVSAFIEYLHIDTEHEYFSVMGADIGYRLQYNRDGRQLRSYLGERTQQGKTYIYYSRDIFGDVFIGLSSDTLEFERCAICDELLTFNGVQDLLRVGFGLSLPTAYDISFVTELMISQIKQQDRQFCFVGSGFRYMKARGFYPFSSRMPGDPETKDSKVKWLN